MTERLRIKEDKKNFLESIKDALIKTRLKGPIDQIARRLMITNELSLEENRKYSTLILGCILLVIIMILSFWPKHRLWYEQIFYILLFLIFSVIIGAIIFSYMKNLFLKELPQTYKLLNSRYVTTGKIQEAIKISIKDLAKPVQREMKRINDTLNLNSMGQIEEAFEQIDRTYQDPFFSLLLELIKKAHYQGGTNVVKEQFEELTDEILDEIENQRDLTAASRTGMLVAIVAMPTLMAIYRFFTVVGLGAEGVAFYESPQGILIKFMFYFGSLFIVGLLYYLEKTI